MFRAQQNHFDDAVGKLHQSLLRQIHCTPGAGYLKKKLPGLNLLV